MLNQVCYRRDAMQYTLVRRRQYTMVRRRAMEHALGRRRPTTYCRALFILTGNMWPAFACRMMRRFLACGGAVWPALRHSETRPCVFVLPVVVYGSGFRVWV